MEGPSCIVISQKALVSRLCFPRLRARRAHEMSPVTRHRTPPLEPSAASPRLLPHLRKAPMTMCWLCPAQTALRHGCSNTAAGKTVPCPEIDMKLGSITRKSWQRLESGTEKSVYIPPKSAATKDGIFLTGLFSRRNSSNYRWCAGVGPPRVAQAVKTPLYVYPSVKLCQSPQGAKVEVTECLIMATF